MQALFNLFNPTSATVTPEQKKNQQRLDSALRILSRPAIEISQLCMIEKGIADLKIASDHPVAKKIHDFRAQHPSLKHVNTIKPQVEHELLTASLSNLKTLVNNVPTIPGEILDVNCTLETIKLILSLTRIGKFKKIILHKIDDEVLATIATKCPDLEVLRIQTPNSGCDNFTDAGLGSIAKLQKLKILEINAWDANIINNGFEVLLSTPALQNGLNELTIYHWNLGDKDLNLIAGFKALTSLEFEGSVTTQGLNTLFQSATLKTTLKKITVVTNNAGGEAVSINDVMISALSNYKALQEVNLGSSWQVTEPNLIKFLDALKNIPQLSLRGLTMTPAAAAKIGEMGALTSLKLTDCSKLYVGDFCNLLNNKTNITQMNLGKAGGLFNQDSDQKMAVDKLSQLPKLSALYVSGSPMWDDVFTKFCNAPEMKQHLSELYLTDLKNINAHSLGNIGNLGALTVLRVDNCPQFNDDSLKAIYASPLKNRLVTLQLKDVAITERSFKYINESASLKKLLIANCYAITEEGRAQFFDLSNLQKNLTVLLLDNFLFSDAMVSKLDPFTSLERLCIFNNSLLTDAGTNILFERKKNSGGKLDLQIWWGEDNIIYSLFNGV